MRPFKGRIRFGCRFVRRSHARLCEGDVWGGERMPSALLLDHVFGGPLAIHVLEDLAEFGAERAKELGLLFREFLLFYRVVNDVVHHVLGWEREAIGASAKVSAHDKISVANGF